MSATLKQHGDRARGRHVVLAFALLLRAGFCPGQVPGAERTGEIRLWPEGAPEKTLPALPEAIRLTASGEHVITHVDEPTITPFLPARDAATGAAVLVIPGGGHTEIWIDHEGYAVAAFLREHGVAAFVLKYRLAREKGSTYTVEGTELGDTQRAIRVLRNRSAEWGLDPHRIGVIGFSAGGELAELVSTRAATSHTDPGSTVEALSSIPDFQALLYPQIPSNPLLTANTPPAFLACGGEDRPDISQGLPRLYLAFAALGLPAELHVFAGTGHGFGIRPRNPKPVADWPMLLLEWMRSRKLIP